MARSGTAAAMRALADPPPAAGEAEAVRKYEREPLPDTEGAPGLQAPATAVVPGRHEPPRVLMVLLAVVAVALGLGYFVFA